MADQEELRPEKEWFSFAPQAFPLNAGESQQVEVKLVLPVDARPGDYFAFLEAHPVTSGEGVSIGVAAATKLNFTIKPAGVLGAAVERVRSLLENNAPTSYYVLGAAGGLILIGLVRRNLDISIGRKAKSTEDKENVEETD